MKRVSAPPRLAARLVDANKVTVGRVLVVGGCRTLVGAPALAALGALRAGAGLVKVAVPRSIQPIVAGYRPETTTLDLPETRSGALGATALVTLQRHLPSWDACVLGPGLGRAPASLGFVRTFTQAVDHPLVLDADGLFAFNERAAGLRARRAPTVLTPHEGEAARLLGIASAAAREDRPVTAGRIAEASGAVVVLKGPGSLVTDGKRLYRNTTGSPVLATGGTGDVLAGVIGALLAAGLPAFEAACLGTWAHGAAAERVAAGRDRGLLASELADGLPAALLSVQRKRKR